MTLFRQLVVFLVFGSLLLVTGSLAVSELNTRGYLQNQLHISAHNAAHMLAISTGSALGSNAPLRACLIARATFDQGYYRSIVLLDASGHDFCHFRTEHSAQSVPNWFKAMLPMSPQTGISGLVQGWKILGSVVVQSDADYAYQHLWKLAREDVLLAGSIVLILCLLGYLALSWITSPLTHIEAQAESVLKRDQIVLQIQPRTREFRRVVDAMNLLVARATAMVEDLTHQLDEQRQLLFKDALTGLPNRKAFDVAYASWTHSEEVQTSIALILFELDDFAQINAMLGEERADQVLMQIASRMRPLLDEHQDALIARRQGAQFAILLPDCNQAKGKAVVEFLLSSCRLLGLQRQEHEPGLRFYAGLACSNGWKRSFDVLEQASQALKIARNSTESSYYFQEIPEELPASLSVLGHEPSLIREQLNRLLNEKSIQLYSLPCLDAQKHIVHKEILVRLHVADQVISAADFIPLVEQWGWSERLDELVLELVISHLNRITLEHRPFCPVHVNLSTQSLLSPDFVVRMQERLQQVQSYLSMIRFEIQETAWMVAAEQVRQLASWLHQRGSGLVIDRFSLRLVSLELLSKVPLHAIKLDAALSQIKEHDQRTMIHTLVQLMHGRDIMVYVDSIRNESEWLWSQSLRLDGAQGFWLAQPGLLDDSDHEL